MADGDFVPTEETTADKTKLGVSEPLTVTPAIVQDDIGKDPVIMNTEKRKSRNRVAFMQDLNNRRQAEAMSMPVPTEKDLEGFVTQEDSSTFDKVKGFFEGANDLASSVPAGILDGIDSGYQSLLDMSDMIQGDISQGLAETVAGKTGQTAEEVKAEAEKGLKDGESVGETVGGFIPTLPPQDTTAGKMARSVVAFMTDFFIAGKVSPATKAVAGTKLTTRIGKDSVRAAMAGFMGPQYENNLSNLIQEQPALANPINELLAADPNDTAIERRVKSSLEELALGPVTDGLITGVKAIRSMRKVKRKMGDANPKMADKIYREAEGLDTMGSPDAPSFAVAKEGDEAVTGTPFVNWSRIDTGDDVKSVLKKMVESRSGAIEGAKRGKRSWKETDLAANQLDAWNLVESRIPGDAFNAEEVRAVRQLWVSSGEKLMELAQLATKAPSAENKFMFAKQMQTHDLVQQHAISAGTEAARALNILRMPTGGKAEQLKAIESIVRNSDGTIETIMGKISDAATTGDMGAMTSFMEKWRGVTNKTSDAVRQVWMAGLLSGPKTLARNTVSQTFVLAQTMAERRAAETLGGDVASGETMAMLGGVIEGVKDSFRGSGRTLLAAMNGPSAGALEVAAKMKTGNPIEAIEEYTRAAKEAVMAEAETAGPFVKSTLSGESQLPGLKTQVGQVGALSKEALGVSNKPLGMALDAIDTATRLPFRALTASDEVFKQAGYRAELNARAWRVTSEEVSTGLIKKEQFQTRMKDLVDNPPEKLRLQAQEFAQEITFTNEVGPFGDRLMKLAEAVPVLGRLILPFRRTPINLATHTFERTPLAWLSKRWRDDFRAGGARRDMALTKMATGTGLLMTMADLTMNKQITGGGPQDPGERANLMGTGWQPYSVAIKEEDGSLRFVSYRGTEPLGTSLGIAADMVEILEQIDTDDPNAQMDEIIIAAGLSVGENVTSQTYMQSVSAFFDALSNSKVYGENFFNRMFASVVPSISAEAAKQEDPYMRVVSDRLSAVKARIPGLSKELPFVRDYHGRKVDRRSELGRAYDVVSPFMSKEHKPQPIDDALTELDWFYTRPRKRVNIDGVNIDLDRFPKFYDRYQELAGNALTEGPGGVPLSSTGGKRGLLDELNAIVTGDKDSPEALMWKEVESMPLTEPQKRDTKISMIKGAVQRYRKAALQTAVLEFPEMQDEIRRRSDRPVLQMDLNGGG